MSKSKKVVQEVLEEDPYNSEVEDIKPIKKNSKKKCKDEQKIAVELYEAPPKMKTSKKVVENISDEKPKKKIVKVNAWIDYMKEYNTKHGCTGFSAASSSWKLKKEKEAEKTKKKSKK